MWDCCRYVYGVEGMLSHTWICPGSAYSMDAARTEAYILIDHSECLAPWATQTRDYATFDLRVWLSLCFFSRGICLNSSKREMKRRNKNSTGPSHRK